MAKFEMTAVESSNIKAIGHNVEDKLLRIEFLSGTMGDYYPFSKEEYDQFLASTSKGKYFANKIKLHKLHLPVSDDEVRQSPNSVRNPTEKSMKFDEKQPRLLQTATRIQDHFHEVKNALRERQS